MNVNNVDVRAVNTMVVTHGPLGQLAPASLQTLTQGGLGDLALELGDARKQELLTGAQLIRRRLDGGLGEGGCARDCRVVEGLTAVDQLEGSRRLLGYRRTTVARGDVGIGLRQKKR